MMALVSHVYDDNYDVITKYLTVKNCLCGNVAFLCMVNISYKTVFKTSPGV